MAVRHSNKLHAKCLLASAAIVILFLPPIVDMDFSPPWGRFVSASGSGRSNSVALSANNIVPITVKFVVIGGPPLSSSRSHWKEKCNSTDFQHLIGLPKHVLPNFYYPADTIVANVSTIDALAASRYSRLIVQIDRQNRVQRVYCDS